MLKHGNLNPLYRSHDDDDDDDDETGWYSNLQLHHRLLGLLLFEGLATCYVDHSSSVSGS